MEQRFILFQVHNTGAIRLDTKTGESWILENQSKTRDKVEWGWAPLSPTPEMTL
jgi:hypothetical protein